MVENNNLYVYFDENRSSNWITSEISELVRDTLTSLDFNKVDAEELKNIMRSVVQGDMKETVIVFAQDIAPDTVLYDSSPSSLIRQYLDKGGSIVWIGDIPFFNKAIQNGQNEKDWWRSGAPANILGINPTSAQSPQKARVTEYGRKRGLKTSWTGIRPILLSKGIQVLASTKSDLSIPYMPVSLSGISRFFNRIKGFKFTFGQIGIMFDKETSDKEVKEEKVVLNKKLADGWLKNFNEDYPNSGFIRIWDYTPAALSDQQLDDLYNLALSTLMNIDFQSFDYQ